jgi:phage-related protein
VNKQDRVGVRTAQDIERKYNLSDLLGVKKAVEQNEEVLNKTNAELENFMKSTLDSIGDLQHQLDGSIVTYYHSGVPTLDNYPTNEWPIEDYQIHIGNMYYDKDTGYAYRFFLDGDTYKWVKIADSDVEEALKLANQAQDTADGKRRVFTTTPFIPYDVGDLWIFNKELYVCKTPKSSNEQYSVGDFEKATKYTDDTALNTFVSGEYQDDLKTINSSLDKKAETWYQDNDPSSNWTTEAIKKLHVGDLWFKPSENKSYMYTSSYVWQEVDGVPDNVYDAIDGKAQIFTTQPTTPYYKGDLYTQGTSGDILVCTKERLTGNYTASDWTKAGKYTDDTNLNNFVNNVYPKDLAELTTQIDGKITTWYLTGAPTLTNAPAKDWTSTDYIKHTGDLYYDKATGYTYTFQLNEGVYGWIHIIDTDLTDALAKANSAQDTADNKRRIFLAPPQPPYDNGDLWFNDGDIYICQISKLAEELYAEEDFIIATKYTDDTLAQQVGEELTVLKGTVTTIKESTDEYKIKFDTTIKTIQNETKETIEALETMSYSFGTNELKIANSNDPVNATFNNRGVKVYTYKDLETIMNHNGLGTNKLIVVGESQLANIKVTKAVDENGKACTDFHHLISTIQEITDLE